MAFQTSILRDGEWVTETVNLQAALKASAAPKATSPSLPVPPACGVLSRTIVESPIVQWILAVRLRSDTHNDIAFIGVSSGRNCATPTYIILFFGLSARHAIAVASYLLKLVIIGFISKENSSITTGTRREARLPRS